MPKPMWSFENRISKPSANTISGSTIREYVSPSKTRRPRVEAPRVHRPAQTAIVNEITVDSGRDLERGQQVTADLGIVERRPSTSGS